MADAGTISVRLTALTADFGKNIKKASDSVAQLEKGMKLEQLKKAFNAVENAVRAVADVAPEVQASIDELSTSWDDLLRKFGPGTKAMLDSLKAPLEWFGKMIDKIAYGAAALGAISGGMSRNDFEASYKQDQSKLDFGDKGSAPESSTAGLMLDLAPAKLKPKQNKWADYLADFVWEGMEAAMAALNETGAGGFDFSGAEAGDTVDQADFGFGDEHRRATRSMVDATEAKNFATTGQTVSLMQAGSRVVESSGMAGQMVGNATTGFASGGPMGAVASIGADLLTSSAGFKVLMESLNPLLQAFSDLLGLVVVPLKPLTLIFNKVYKVIRDVVLGIYKLLDKIPGISFAKEIDAMTNATKKSAKEIEKTHKSFSDFNAPTGIKRALAVFDAIQVPTATSVLDSLTGGGRAAGPAPSAASYNPATGVFTPAGSAQAASPPPIVIQNAFIQPVNANDLVGSILRTSARQTYAQTGVTSGSTASGVSPSSSPSYNPATGAYTPGKKP